MPVIPPNERVSNIETRNDPQGGRVSNIEAREAPLAPRTQSVQATVSGPDPILTQALDRLQQGQSGTIHAYWEHAGLAWDPGTVTVTITSDATGTPVVTNAATTGTGTTGRSYVLTPAQTASLDLLTVVWTSASDSSTLTTYCEIVGGYLFTIAQARARNPLGDTTNYPTSSLLYYRTLAEMAIEDICGVAFVPRYTRENGRSITWGMLEVSRRRVNSVLQVTTASNSGQVPIPSLAGLRIENGGLIFFPTTWNFWSFPMQVAYTHGYTYPPPRVSRAALELAKRWVIESPWDERMTAFKSREGGEVDILTAKSDPFDLPEVVAIGEIYGSPMIG